LFGVLRLENAEFEEELEDGEEGGGGFRGRT